MTKFYETTISGPEVVYCARALAAEGMKISAIKLIRQSTGWGLKESKEFVERGCVDFTYDIGDKFKNSFGHETVEVIQRNIVGIDEYYWCKNSAGMATYTKDTLARYDRIYE